MACAEPLLVGLRRRVILRTLDDEEDTRQEHSHQNQRDQPPDDHTTVDISGIVHYISLRKSLGPSKHQKGDREHELHHGREPGGDVSGAAVLIIQVTHCRHHQKGRCDKDNHVTISSCHLHIKDILFLILDELH